MRRRQGEMTGMGQTSRDREPVVLLVEGNRTLRDAIRAHLSRRLPIQVVAAGSASQALALAAERKPSVIILDLSLPDRPGVGAVSALRSVRPDASVIVLSSFPGAPGEVAPQLGSCSFLRKEALGSELEGVVWRSLPTSRLDLSARLSRWIVVARGASLAHRARSVVAWIGRGIRWVDRNAPWAGQPRTRLLYLANVAMIVLTFVLRQHGAGM